MTNTVIHLTVTELITSFIIYGVVHAAWSTVRWCLKQLETEAGKVIKTHVKNGHEGRFKNCFKGDCATAETAPDSPRLVAGM